MAGTADVDEIVELANELRAIILRLARHLRSQAHASGLTGGQIAILVAIEFNPGMTAQLLAEREGLSAPGVSGHLARLEGKGLVERERAPGGRNTGLFLTSSGQSLVAAVRQQRTSWLTGRLADIPSQDRELIKASLSILDRLSIGDR
jgi:DNA-binding MarR family transcriptional regulator